MNKSQHLIQRLRRLHLRLDDRPEIARRLYTYQEHEALGRSDPELFEILDMQIGKLEAEHLQSPLIEPPIDSGLDEGDFHILNTREGVPVRISFDEGRANSVTHLGVAGQSGTGKSSMLSQLATECAGRTYSLILDPVGFYRRVKSLHSKYYYVHWSQIRLNPFDEIDDVPTSQLDQLMVKEFVDAYRLQFGEYEISEVVQEIRKTNVPNWSTICEALRVKKYPGVSRRWQYRDSALLVLNNMLRATSELFVCRRGMNLQALLSNNVVLELNGLLPEHAAYVTRYVFSYLYLLRTSSC